MKRGMIKRGPWTAEEDSVLAGFVRKEGEGRWRTLPSRAGLQRCGKSCRLRWMNYLRPDVKRGHISPAEEDLILRLHRLLGNRWSLIAGRIPGRTDNEIKNYWNTHLSKKLISQGIDPRTHKPFDHQSKPPPPSANDTNRPARTVLRSLDKQNHPNKKIKQAPPTESSREDDQALVQATTNHNDQPASDFDSDNVIGFRSSTDDLVLDNDLNYCSDDMFSSFLNSLINDDDAFATNSQLPIADNFTDLFSATNDHYPFISVNSTTAAPNVVSPSSSSSFTQMNDNPRRIDDPVE